MISWSFSLFMNWPQTVRSDVCALCSLESTKCLNRYEENDMPHILSSLSTDNLLSPWKVCKSLFIFCGKSVNAVLLQSLKRYELSTCTD